VGIRQVAAEAGVSPTTVSQVLNDVPGARISDATRERVRRVAKRLGYGLATPARGLRTRRSRTITLFSDEIATTPFAGRMLAGAQKVAREHGTLLLVVINAERDDEFEEREIELLRQRQVDGVLYATMYHREITLPEGLEDLPTVVLDAVVPGGRFDCVVPDEEAGGRQAARVLIEAGHHRLGFINNMARFPARVGREKGFLNEVAGAGRSPAESVVVYSGATVESGYFAARSLLDMDPRPTGVFCFNDQIAMGLYRAAAESGLRIPADLSVIGFDNLELIAAGLFPGLTTIELPHHEMGVAAMRRLFSIIEDPAAPHVPAIHRIAGKVVSRGSVAPPPHH
jgi:LacI family transcriptional regulator